MVEFLVQLMVDAEETAARVVSAIEKMMTSIKAIPEFSPSLKSPVDLSHLDLLRRLEDQNVVRYVDETLQLAQCKVGFKVSGEDISTPFDVDSRSRLVSSICIPLLVCLTDCYRILDRIAEAKRIERPGTPKNGKPPPPRGMLSIQNYTDIAAFIEFVVCTSILPNLEPHILTSVNDRAQYLIPKSLAGRLSRISLLWGSAAEKELGCLNASFAELCASSVAITRLLCLDRFRPMLLPRHIADTYAAFFQMEHLHQQLSQTDSNRKKYEELRALYLPRKAVHPIVDPTTQARVFQTLLFQGTKGPKWLRRRVSTLLTALATHNLAAVIQVFVRAASSSQDDMTSAALRLAKALSTVPNQNEEYYRILCLNLVRLLDVQLPTASPLDSGSAAGILTAWSVLEQLSEQQLQTLFLPHLLNGFMPSNVPGSVHRSIHRMLVLLSVLPKTANKDRISQLYMASLPKADCSLLALIIRVGSMHTIEISPVRSDAISCLQQLCCILNEGTVHGANSSDLVAQALLHSFAPNQWDVKNKFEMVNSSVHVGKSNMITDERSLIKGMERKVDLVVSRMLELRNLNEGLQNITRSLFHLLLTLHFESLSSEACQIIGFDSPTIQLAAMMMLPALVEATSPERIILGNASDSSGILSTIKLILEAARDPAEAWTKPKNFKTNARQFHHSNRVLVSMLGIGGGCIPRLAGTLDCTQTKESLLSTTSLVISILVTMLELGCRRRNQKERHLLDSIAISLASLATISKNESLREDEGVVRVESEIAEMASHALALIRSDEVSADRGNGESGTKPSFHILLKESENDLKSEYPPIRARGIVRLRHLVRGFLRVRGEIPPLNSLIVEVSEVSTFETNRLTAILRITFLALCDEESYVFLAAIQTTVAAADVCPVEVIEIVAWSICTGKSLPDNEINSDLRISIAQRMKLVEALMFIIRRRGAAVDQYISTVLNMMLFGSRQRSRETNSNEQKRTMQESVYSYFLNHSPETNELTDPNDLAHKKQIKVATGGPVFSIEENDLVRAGCMSIVGDLISASHPRSLVDHTPELVSLVTSALTLDSSQPIRRTAVLVGAALYDCALREFDFALDNGVPEEYLGATRTLVVALVESNEELMCNIIEQTITSHGDERYDPATNARCEEALNARVELEEKKIIALARMNVEAKRKDENKLDSFLVHRTVD